MTAPSGVVWASCNGLGGHCGNRHCDGAVWTVGADGGAVHVDRHIGKLAEIYLLTVERDEYRFEHEYPHE